MNNIKFIFLFFILLTGCVKKTDKISSERPEPVYNMAEKYLIADSITYDVNFKNLDPDNKWAEKYFEDLTRASFIDSIFEAIYKGKQIAYDYNSGEALTIKQVKELEEEQPELRNKISKIQFTEEWYFNSQDMVFEKKVKSIIFGVPNYIDTNILFGYKPVFRIEMN